MGFSEVILIGVDHHFVTSGAPNREVVSEGEDPNHFHPQYFGSGVRWNLPDLENSEVAYTLAREAYTEAGRQILDATLDGRLTVFPKVDYQRLFEQYREQDQTLPSHYAEVYAKNRRGEELYQAGEREQAMRLFDEILDRVPNYGPTLNNLGVALWEGGDFQQALRSFYLALKANPEDRSAIINLAEALGCMDVDPQSLTVLQRYSSAHPDDAEVAQLLQEIGR
ncbi:Beta-barrel assembly-enhancing protease [compost metagenome]